MKFSFFIGLSLMYLASPLTLNSQKQNVTDAAMLMNKYNPMSGVIEAKKLVEKAKGFIDIASVNPETAEDFKMHFYQAQIYFAMIELASMSTNSEIGLDEYLLKEYEAKSKESFKKVMSDPKKKWISDAEQFINLRSSMAFEMGIQSYNNKNFISALQLFCASHAIKGFLDVDFKDASINATLSLNQVLDSLLQIKDFTLALKISEEAHKTLPLNIDIIISIININLQKGDFISSEKYLNKALLIDSKNKQLYYVLGTSYIDLKENEKAEEALMKAIEIDPNYTEAQYQLGAHLFNWANDIKLSADQLEFNDPNAPLLVEKSSEILKRSLIILEKYIAINPNEKEVLEILWKSYYKIGDDVKSAEYKKRAQEIK
jgi:tetratricopeptide (TPR) repeat protein